MEVLFSELLGKTLISITNKDNEEVSFVTKNNEQYLMFHEQDCCESVMIEDIIGNLDDLLNTPIIMAEEITEEGEYEEFGDSSTWTFYKLATIKGYVTIRWFGQSNGYYSESVCFKKK